MSVSEVQVAEKEIFRHVQKLSFPDVAEALQRVTKSQESSHQVKQGLRKLKMTTSLGKLNPMLDGEGILQGGRLENAAITYDAKHQIILPASVALDYQRTVQKAWCSPWRTVNG